MLVLSRHRDEAIYIGEDVKIMVVEIRGDKVRLGVEAPRHVPVHRSEVFEAMRRTGGIVSGAVGRKHAAASLADKWACSPLEVFDRAMENPADAKALDEELARLRAEAGHT